MTPRDEELEILETTRTILKRELTQAESTREIQIVSSELRQVLKHLAEVKEAIAIEQSDADLEGESDPAVVAEALLRDLPELCRCQPEIAVAIRDKLIEVVPLRGPVKGAPTKRARKPRAKKPAK